MSRRGKLAVAVLSMLALVATCEVAHAQPTEPGASSPASPPFTLEVDSDAPDVISFEALAARIGSDLAAPVTRPGPAAASRAAIAIRFRGGELTVRAVHQGGRVLERTVKTQGDDAAVQREAVLLASNLARDEAREILDALAARPAPVVEPAPAPPPASSPLPAPNDGATPVTVSFFYPLATNLGRPNVATWFSFSLLYDRIGTAHAQLGSGVLYASRRVSGLQLGALGSASGGAVTGAQIGVAGNIARGNIEGAQLSSGANVARSGMTGAQLAVGLNLAQGSVTGVELSSGANIAARDVTGVQLAPFNFAESVDGVQAGVVNIARRVRGAQLGIVNIADEVEGTSLGIISISRGGVHPIVWGSNLHYMNAGVKFSTKYVYTITAFQYGTLETGLNKTVGTSVAVGGHIPIGPRFDIELEVALTNLSPNPSRKDSNTWLASHVLPGYSFARHLRVFAGGGVRWPVAIDVGRPVPRPEVLAGVQF